MRLHSCKIEADSLCRNTIVYTVSTRRDDLVTGCTQPHHAPTLFRATRKQASFSDRSCLDSIEKPVGISKKVCVIHVVQVVTPLRKSEFRALVRHAPFAGSLRMLLASPLPDPSGKIARWTLPMTSSASERAMMPWTTSYLARHEQHQSISGHHWSAATNKNFTYNIPSPDPMTMLR